MFVSLDHELFITASSLVTVHMVSDYGVIAIGTLVFIALGVIATCFVGLTPHKQFALHISRFSIFIFIIFVFSCLFFSVTCSFLGFSSHIHGVPCSVVGFFGSAFSLRKWIHSWLLSQRRKSKLNPTFTQHSLWAVVLFIFLPQDSFHNFMIYPFTTLRLS